MTQWTAPNRLRYWLPAPQVQERPPQCQKYGGSSMATTFAISYWSSGGLFCTACLEASRREPEWIKLKA